MIKLILKTSLALIFTVSVIITGCNKVKGLLDINFDADFTVDMSVDASGSGLGNGLFDVEENVDPLENEDVKKYIDNIKDWTVTDLTLKFKQVNPEFDLSEGKVKMYNGQQEVAWNLEDQQVSENTEIILGNDNNQWTTVNEMIKQKEPFTVDLSGKAIPGSQFKVQLVFKSKITANPL